MTKARFEKDVSADWNGEAHLFVLDAPCEYTSDWDDEGNAVKSETKFVVVSATRLVLGGVETMAFPSDADGNVEDFNDLGCVRALDIEECLREMGFVAVYPKGAAVDATTD